MGCITECNRVHPVELLKILQGREPPVRIEPALFCQILFLLLNILSSLNVQTQEKRTTLHSYFELLCYFGTGDMTNRLINMQIYCIQRFKVQTQLLVLTSAQMARKCRAKLLAMMESCSWVLAPWDRRKIQHRAKYVQRDSFVRRA